MISLLMLLAAPVLDPVNDGPAPANAAYYSECFADATTRGAVARQGRWLLYRCQGAPARKFYEKLGALPADKTAVEARGGRVWRFTTKPEKDTDGIDGCWRDVSAAGSDIEYGCRLIFAAGPFLDEP